MNDFSPTLFDYILLVFVLAVIFLAKWIRFRYFPSRRGLFASKARRNPSHDEKKEGVENVPLQKSIGRP